MAGDSKGNAPVDPDRVERLRHPVEDFTRDHYPPRQPVELPKGKN